MRPPLAALALLALLPACSTLSKDAAWDDLVASVAEDVARVRESHASPLLAEAEGGPPVLLGVRAPLAVKKFQVGVPVLHVFARSPAAAAGLVPGDEVRSIGGKSVRTTVDLRSALYELAAAGTKSSIVYARRGQELRSDLTLVPRELWLAERRLHLLEEARVDETWLPLIYRRLVRRLSPETVFAHYGALPPEPVKVSDDVDILPIVLSLSLVRVELMPLLEGNRVTVLWPFEIETTGDDVSWDLRGLVATPAGVDDL